MNRKTVTLCSTLGLSFGIAGTHLQHVFADGAPDKTKEPLVYAGTLDEDGMPASGTKNVRITLYSDAEKAGTEFIKCITESPTTHISKGRFRIPLDPSCSDAVAAGPDLWIGIEVGGVPMLRRKLGAVPFSLEAAHATTAEAAATASAASGALQGSIKELADRVAKLEGGVGGLIQTGRTAGSYQLADWKLNVGTGSRSYLLPVKFKTPFTKIPEVVAAFDALDIVSSDGDQRVNVVVQDVTTTGFVASIGTWYVSAVHSAGVSWVAVQR